MVLHIGILQRLGRWCGSRRQLVDYFTHGAVELVQPLPAQSPVEGGADVSAGQPKFDVIHLVGHLVLGAFQTVFDSRKSRRRLTLIIASITLTEPNTALASGMVEISFARFKVSMAPFNAEIALPCALGR